MYTSYLGWSAGPERSVSVSEVYVTDPQLAADLLTTCSNMFTPPWQQSKTLDATKCLWASATARCVHCCMLAVMWTVAQIGVLSAQAAQVRLSQRIILI